MPTTPLEICTPETNWTFLDDKDLEKLDADQKVLAEQFAWSTLAALCNYRIGTCPISVRPCAERCAPQGTYRPAIAGGGYPGLQPFVIGRPYLGGTAWISACGCRPSGCNCSDVQSVVLPGPVGRVVRVMIDGVELPREDYRVLNGTRLVRLDGGTWPLCQDPAAADDEGLVVTYYRGAAPNRMTAFAAGILANEYILLWAQNAECRLPANLQSMSRSGESYEFGESFPNGRTGIFEVDSVIEIYNPHGLRSPVIIASPDAYETTVRS